MKKLIIFFCFIAITSITQVFSQSFKVIVNNSNTVASMSQKEISDLFLKKKNKWPSGTTVMPVDLSSNSAVRENFSQQVHGKGTSAIRNFWQQAAFSGAGTAPSEKSNDSDVIDYVKKNPGAIGYVSAAATTAGVKTISIK